LKDGYRLGQLIAQNNLGCVSGAGTTGVMGAVVRGSVDAGGWTGGSNVPHIIELEGLPNGLSSFWLRPDIYTRMEVMIQHSDAFVIFPGGAGTVQEVLALLIFKQMDHSLMHGKPIIIFNRPVEGTEAKFWDKLIELLKPWNAQSLFKVVDRLDEIIPSLKDLLLERRAL
ncbi:MAG: LOG family protein, partial [Verrucomicrobiota bacterium]